MTTHRPERVADLIRQVLSGIILGELRDPRVANVTVTEVRVAPDLKHARVFVTRLGEADEVREAVDALNHAAPFLRRTLGRRVRLKYVPDLLFVHDVSLETGMRVDDLLREISRDSDGDAEPGDDDGAAH